SCSMNRLWVLTALAVAVAALYLARAVVVPIALAMLLAFMVHPIVTQLTKIGLGRGLSVAVVVTMLFVALGAACWILMIEFASLSTQIPVYRDNLIRKINEVRRLGKGGALEKAQTAATDVAKEWQKSDVAQPKKSPTPVVVTQEPTGLWQLPSVVEGVGGAAAVIVLVIFMLIEREDLRNRVVRLGGYARLITTTRALDEASQRISRYLLMQSIINTSFGAGVAIGLLLLGVPYALLWGFLAGLLRFIPYVGVALAAALLITFALAAYPTWVPPLLVAGLVAALELACSVVLEPLLYGQSAGVSQVALLCSVTFWAWLWGPLGLLLATPLTVCLVVLAKHVPGLEFVGILMSDEPAIAPPAAYYQRLLADDRGEAERIASTHAQAHGLEAAFDDVIVPALRHARRDHRDETLSDAEMHRIWKTTQEIVDELAARRPAEPAASESAGPPAEPYRAVRVLAVPVRDAGDAIGLAMLVHLLSPGRWDVEIASPHALASEVIARTEETRPAVVCLGGLPASPRSAHTRYLCKRLRARFSDLRIIVGRWGLRESAAQVRRQLEAAGADYVGLSLVETREHLQRVHALEPPTFAPPAAAEASLR
ncbi:MAG TPA: AI-2E family transporter, partial [Methylomirabilota bacterium]